VEDNIKIDVREIEWGVMDWIRLTQDIDQWRTLAACCTLSCTLKKEPARPFESPAKFYQTTWRHISKDDILLGSINVVFFGRGQFSLSVARVAKHTEHQSGI
jgi:hypothetical protein